MRQTHYLLPLLAAGALFAVVLLLWRKEPLRRAARLTGRVGPLIVPRLLAITTFLAGTILLFSTATPAVGGRLRWLDRVLPLPVVEVSHVFAGLVGVGLLILARGIQRRLDAAYHLTTAMLAAGILFSLLKAFDYEEALVLSVMLLLLVPSRRYFYRRTSLIEERFTPGWWLAIGLVVIGSVILGIRSYSTAFGDQGLGFWQFEWSREAPRFVRSTIGAIAALTVFATMRLIRPAKVMTASPTPEEMEQVDRAARESTKAATRLVYLGDKALLFAEQGAGFVMYGVSGRSWVSLFDPVGTAAELPDLVLRFIQLVDRHGGWPVFYQVGRETLPLYLDVGLSVVKLGEEARVELPTFSLEGAERRNLRRVWRKAVQDGCSFVVIPAEQVPDELPALRRISDTWLRDKRTREKGFSLGAFDDHYVTRFPAAVVRSNGQLVAFASLWCSGGMEEIQVDLMRYTAAAPPGVMRYLMIEAMLWGRASGYRWFNLGMAPLSGLRSTAVAPLWLQLGRVVYGYGERFYNFQGVRTFKEWFYPVWEPKYLVSPGSVSRPVVLANIASLIAGGLGGVVRR